jgi:hypothetical protein
VDKGDRVPGWNREGERGGLLDPTELCHRLQIRDRDPVYGRRGRFDLHAQVIAGECDRDSVPVRGSPSGNPWRAPIIMRWGRGARRGYHGHGEAVL